MDTREALEDLFRAVCRAVIYDDPEMRPDRLIADRFESPRHECRLVLHWRNDNVLLSAFHRRGVPSRSVMSPWGKGIEDPAEVIGTTLTKNGHLVRGRAF